MTPQMALVASCADATNVTAWSVDTSTPLGILKLNSSCVNGMAVVGDHSLVTTQANKDCLHFYSWHKQTAIQKSFVPERMLSVACSPDGLLLAAGGTSGTIHVWDLSTGRLLRSWAAHYRAVTVLKFDDSGVLLVSGGEDTVLAVWQLMGVLDLQQASRATHSVPIAWRSWSEHSLPITGLHLTGSRASVIAYSVSSDHSLRAYSLAADKVLGSVTLPAPLSCVAVHPLQDGVFAGGQDGRVYAVDTSSWSGAGPSVEGEWRSVAAHTGRVTALCCTPDGRRLLSGSTDGAVHTWDTHSLQLVSSLLNPCKGGVSGLAVLDTPPALEAAAAASGAPGRRGPERVPPLAPLCKFPGTPAGYQAWDVTRVLVDGSTPFQDCAARSGVAALLDPSAGSREVGPHRMQVGPSPEAGQRQEGASTRGDVGGETKAREEVARLLRERDAALAEGAAWKKLHEDLYAFTEGEVMADARVVEAAAPPVAQASQKKRHRKHK